MAGYNWLVDLIERQDLRSKVETQLRNWFDRRVVFQLRKLEEPANGEASTGGHRPSASRDARLMDEPLHQLIVERFEARPIRVEDEVDEPAGS